MSVVAIGGGGVQNDGYERLEKFIVLEKNNQLEYAKMNPQNYDRMLQFDIKEFKNSIEFRDYLQKYDYFVDRDEAICTGWFLAFLCEITIAFSGLLTAVFRKTKRLVAR